jgi:hypothetical protein
MAWSDARTFSRIRTKGFEVVSVRSEEVVNFDGKMTEEGFEFSGGKGSDRTGLNEDGGY